MGGGVSCSPSSRTLFFHRCLLFSPRAALFFVLFPSLILISLLGFPKKGANGQGCWFQDFQPRQPRTPAHVFATWFMVTSGRARRWVLSIPVQIWDGPEFKPVSVPAVGRKKNQKKKKKKKNRSDHGVIRSCRCDRQAFGNIWKVQMMIARCSGKIVVCIADGLHCIEKPESLCWGRSLISHPPPPPNPGKPSSRTMPLGSV